MVVAKRHVSRDQSRDQVTVYVSKNQVCVFQQSSLRFAEIKFAFQRIKITFQRIKSYFIESSCCKIVNDLHRAPCKGLQFALIWSTKVQL